MNPPNNRPDYSCYPDEKTDEDRMVKESATLLHKKYLIAGVLSAQLVSHGRFHSFSALNSKK
jgi:hypothetical protein